MSVSDLPPALLSEYTRWREQLAEPPVTGRDYVSADDVLRAHFLIVDHFSSFGGEGVGGVGPKHLGLLESAVARQYSYFGDSRWSGVFDNSANVFFGLISNHVFHDANKRTALLVALHQLKCSKWVPAVPHKQFENLAVRVAERRLNTYPERKKHDSGPDGDIRFLSQFFKKNTRKEEQRSYVVTYQQLDRLLRRFGYYLDSPRHNKIDIVRDEEVVVRRTIFGKPKKTQTRPKRIGEIGFHDWKSQVPIKELKLARQLTRTGGQDGVDSRAFFEGLDTLESLIPQYEGALRRLADR